MQAQNGPVRIYVLFAKSKMMTLVIPNTLIATYVTKP